MAKNDMKKADLIAMTGLSKSTIYRILDDPNHDANISSLEAIARVFGIKISELIED